MHERDKICVAEDQSKIEGVSSSTSLPPQQKRILFFAVVIYFYVLQCLRWIQSVFIKSSSGQKARHEIRRNHLLRPLVLFLIKVTHNVGLLFPHIHSFLVFQPRFEEEDINGRQLRYKSILFKFTTNTLSQLGSGNFKIIHFNDNGSLVVWILNI